MLSGLVSGLVSYHRLVVARQASTARQGTAGVHQRPAAHSTARSAHDEGVEPQKKKRTRWPCDTSPMPCRETWGVFFGDVGHCAQWLPAEMQGLPPQDAACDRPTHHTAVRSLWPPRELAGYELIRARPNVPLPLEGPSVSSPPRTSYYASPSRIILSSPPLSTRPSHVLFYYHCPLVLHVRRQSRPPPSSVPGAPKLSRAPLV